MVFTTKASAAKKGVVARRAVRAPRQSGTPEMTGERIDDVHTDGIDRVPAFHE
jgi:hypothetical protein